MLFSYNDLVTVNKPCYSNTQPLEIYFVELRCVRVENYRKTLTKQQAYTNIIQLVITERNTNNNVKKKVKYPC